MFLKLNNSGKLAHISDEDAELASYSWCLHPKGYVQGHGGGKLHRKVMERKLGRKLASNELIDHCDRNKLNNTRENLRLATGCQNQWNKWLQKSNTTGYKGVYKVRQQWRAIITANHKKNHLGYFPTAESAARAYDKAAIELHGEFAVLNFPEEREQTKLLDIESLVDKQPKVDQNMSFRLTEAERQALTAFVEQQGTSISTLVRQLVISHMSKTSNIELPKQA